MKKTFYLLKGFSLEYLIILFINSLLYGLEAFFHPILLKLLFDEGIIKKNLKLFFIFVVSYLFIGLFLNFASLGINLWNKSLYNKILKKNVSKMLLSYYNKNYMSKRDSSYFIQVIYKDVSEGLIPLLEEVKNLIAKIISCLVFLFILFYLSWQATFILLCIIPLLTYFSKIINVKVRKLTGYEREYEGSFLGVLGRAISSFKILKIGDLFWKTKYSCEKSMDEFLKTAYKNFKFIQIYRTLGYVSMNISDACSLAVASYFLFKGVLTFGGYLAFVNTFWRAVTGIVEVFAPLAEISRFLTITQRVYNFQKEKTTFYGNYGSEIYLKNVKVFYEDILALDNISLNIKSGEKVLIVGENGSGKTTLANIIGGYLEVQEGEVTLFKKTIALTLPYDFPPLKLKDIDIKEKYLKNFRLSELKENFLYELSAGEKQKTAIALALSQDADCYIFDEPLANIDKESSLNVIEAIFERTKGKTLIMIMHDYNGLENFFDKLIYMEKGKIKKIEEKNGIPFSYSYWLSKEGSDE